MTIIHAKTALTPAGWATDLAIDVGADGRIRAVGPLAGKADHVMDLVLPAPLNLHSHAFQRAMAGLTEFRGPDPRDSFWTWRRLMYSFLDKIGPDEVEAIAAFVFMEMAEAGYGAVAEFHYLHHAANGVAYDDRAELSARIIAAAETAGIGLTHLPVYYEFGGCDRRALAGGQLRFGNDFDGYAAIHQGAAKRLAMAPADYALGVAPHSLRAVDVTGLARIETLAGSNPIHIHIAEQVAEVDEVLAHRGARPVEWLLANAPVDQRWCLIHATQMTEAETLGVAKAGAVAGLCPITESNLGDGIFDGVRFLGAQGAFGVGSDSNVHISLWAELSTLEYSQRLRDRSRAALATADKSTGRVLFEGAVAGGAQAGQRAARGIAAGEWADLIGISTDNAWLDGRKGDRLLDSLIFGGHGQRAITDVWSAGRHMVTNGAHVQAETITRNFRRAIAKLEAN